MTELWSTYAAYREAGDEQITNRNGAQRAGVPVQHEDAELSDKNSRDDRDAMAGK
jgi:hypothetical protein